MISLPPSKKIISFRDARQSDIPFLKEILYEAVFWRESPGKPSFEEGLAYPEVRKSLAGWGERRGDTAVIAQIDAAPIGAGWFRYWTEGSSIRGFIDAATPVLVIGVVAAYRRQGIATKLMQWLLEAAAKQSIPKISLMVSKDNHAFHLYKQQGFEEHADVDDSIIMVRNTVF